MYEPGFSAFSVTSTGRPSSDPTTQRVGLRLDLDRPRTLFGITWGSSIFQNEPAQNSPDQRSSFTWGRRFFASVIARSAMCLTAQSKSAGVSELTSRSGRGS